MQIIKSRLLSLLLISCIGLSCARPVHAGGLLPAFTKKNVVLVFASGCAFLILTALINEIYQDYQGSRSPLHHACRDNDLERVRVLVQNGANINQMSYCRGNHLTNYFSFTGTPLHVACASGNEEVVKYLLDNGAHIDTMTQNGEYGLAPIYYACWHRHFDIIKILIQRGANTKKVTKNSGDSVVHTVIWNDSDLVYEVPWRGDILKYLLEERGEDPNCKNRYGSCPVNVAYFSFRFNPEAIKILVDNGANICNTVDTMSAFGRVRTSLKNRIETGDPRYHLHDLCETFKRQIEKQENLQTILDNIANNSRTLEDEKETIKNYIRDAEVPIYIKLSAIAVLADSYFSDADIVGREELIELMRYAQFNYRFFHDAALRNAVIFAMRTNAVDHRGRTVIQAAPIYIHDADAVMTLVAQSGSMFYRRNFDFDNDRTAFRKSLEIFENDEAEKDEFEKILKKTKDTKNKTFFRSLGNTAIVVEDLQKELMVKDEQNQDKIYQSGFPPELAAKITDYIGGDYGKTLYFKRELIQEESEVKEKEKINN